MPSRPASPSPRSVRVVLSEVLIADDAGARAILRRDGKATRGAVHVEIPLGPADAAALSCALHGLPRAPVRPSWQGLFGATLAVAGLRVRRIDLDALAGTEDVVGELAIQAASPAGDGPRRDDATRVAAPVEAALLIALETGAPLYVRRAAAARLRERRAPEPAGQALLATLLASLPDEDFGEMH